MSRHRRTFQRVQEIHHAGSDDGLLHPGRLRQRLAFPEVLVSVCVVLERAPHKTRQLPVVAIIEDGEVLAVSGQVRRQSLAAQSINEGVGCERGHLEIRQAGVTTAMILILTRF